MATLDEMLLAPSVCSRAGAVLIPGSQTEAVAAAMQAIQEGQYLSALEDAGVTEALQKAAEKSGSLKQAILACTNGFHEASGASASLHLVAAVAAFQLFLQCNITGPYLTNEEEARLAVLFEDVAPTSSSDMEGHRSAAPHSPSSGTRNGTPTADSDSNAGIEGLRRWAEEGLAVDGELVEGKHSHAELLLLAHAILVAAPGLDSRATEESSPLMQQHPSWAWWAMRVEVTRQRMLQGRSASLQSLLRSLADRVLDKYAGGRVHSGVQPRSRLAASAMLECALAELEYGAVRPAEELLTRANQAAGISISLTGALGKRTVHQMDPKAQLVAITAESGHRANGHTGHLNGHIDDSGSQWNGMADIEGDEEDSDDAAWLDRCSLGEGSDGSERPASSSLAGVEDESDVLPAPQLTDTAGAPLQRPLTSLEQALLLGWAAHVRHSRAKDDLLGWQIAPYAEAVLAQQHSRAILRAAARLQQARHERRSNRTRMRALVTLQQLAEAPACPQPPTHTRLRCCMSVAYPLQAALAKEMGEEFVSNGLVGQAMELFERQELWDNLILCCQLLGKKPQAVSLIHRELQSRPDDARLWCALGDLELRDDHYQTAWERSGCRSARAQRSLARAADIRKDWARAVEHWEAALKISPLHPAGWFALGFGALKLKDFTRAVRAYTRCAQLEPENGDAWNNLAAVHLQGERWLEAYSALGEAIKLKRGSWQTWSNYALAAMRTDHPVQACRGVLQVLELSKGAQIELEVLTSLVAGVLARRSQHEAAGSNATVSDATQAGLDKGIGEALKAASTSATSPPASLWAMRAQFHRALKEPLVERECWQRAMRGLEGSDWQHNKDCFEHYAEASLGFAQACLAQAQLPNESPAQLLSSARLHLNRVVKHSHDSFSETEQFSQLRDQLATVNAAREQL